MDQLEKIVDRQRSAHFKPTALYALFNETQRQWKKRENKNEKEVEKNRGSHYNSRWPV